MTAMRMSSFAPGTRAHDRGDKLQAAAVINDVLRNDRRVNGWDFILFGIRFRRGTLQELCRHCSTSQFLEFAALRLHTAPRAGAQIDPAMTLPRAGRAGRGRQ